MVKFDVNDVNTTATNNNPAMTTIGQNGTFMRQLCPYLTMNARQ